MYWNQFFSDGLGDPSNHFVNLIVYPTGTYDYLCIGTVSRSDPPNPMFFRIKQITWEYEGIVLPDVFLTNVSLPLQLTGIGPMTLVPETIQSGGDGDAWSWFKVQLYVNASANSFAVDGQLLGSPTVVWKGDYGVNWSVSGVIIEGSDQSPIVGFKEKVFIGTGAQYSYAHIWSNVSGTWSRVADEIAANKENMATSSFYALPNVLYAGTWGNPRVDHGAEIWKTQDGLNWELEHSFSDPTELGVICMTWFDGHLYAGTVNHALGTQIWRKEDSSWRKVGPQWPPNATPEAKPVRANAFLVSPDGKTLYAGAGGPRAVLLTSQNGLDWNVDYTLSDDDHHNYVINSLAWFRDYTLDQTAPPSLFAGVTNIITGAEVWRYGPLLLPLPLPTKLFPIPPFPPRPRPERLPSPRQE